MSDLRDYTDPNDPYAPRSRAAQAVAAAKRAQRHGTEPLTPVTTSTRWYLPIGTGAVLIILAMIGMASYQLAQAPAHPLQITSLATDAAAAPTATPEPPSTPTMESYIASAYAAPDGGALLGPVNLGSEAVIAVARAGTAWVMLERPSGDRVWF